MSLTISAFPLELISEIAGHLPINSSYSFLSICKAFENIRYQKLIMDQFSDIYHTFRHLKSVYSLTWKKVYEMSCLRFTLKTETYFPECTVFCLINISDEQIAFSYRHKNEYYANVRTWNFIDRRSRLLQGQVRTIDCLLGLPNGDIAIGSQDGLIRIWNISENFLTEKNIKDTTFANYVPLKWILPLKDRLDNQYICTVSTKGIFNLWHPPTDASRTFEYSSWVIKSILKLGSHFIVYGDRDGKLKLINLAESVYNTFKEHTAEISCLIALKKEGWIASGSKDTTLRIWNLKQGSSIKLEGHTGKVSALLEIPGGLLVSGAHDKTIRIWDMKTYQCIHCLQGHTMNIKFLAKLPNQHIASFSSDETIKIWDLKDLKALPRTIPCQGISTARKVNSFLQTSSRIFLASKNGLKVLKFDFPHIVD